MKSHVDEQLLADANARLKAARIRVTIRCQGEALYLRATLPPKPGSRRVKPGLQASGVGEISAVSGG